MQAEGQSWDYPESTRWPACKPSALGTDTEIRGKLTIQTRESRVHIRDPTSVYKVESNGIMSYSITTTSGFPAYVNPHIWTCVHTHMQIKNVHWSTHTNKLLILRNGNYCTQEDTAAGPKLHHANPPCCPSILARATNGKTESLSSSKVWVS